MYEETTFTGKKITKNPLTRAECARKMSVGAKATLISMPLTFLAFVGLFAIMVAASVATLDELNSESPFIKALITIVCVAVCIGMLYPVFSTGKLIFEALFTLRAASRGEFDIVYDVLAYKEEREVRRGKSFATHVETYFIFQKCGKTLGHRDAKSGDHFWVAVSRTKKPYVFAYFDDGKYELVENEL